MLWNKTSHTPNSKHPLTDTRETMVLASSEAPSLMVYGLIGLVVLLVGLAVGALFLIRRPVKPSYEEYIRSKYYDL